MVKTIIVIIFLSVAVLAQTPAHSVGMHWNGPTGPGISFRIYRATTANPCPNVVNLLNTGSVVTTLWYTDTSPSGNNTYHYQVSATNGKESTCSNDSGPVTIPPDATAAPPAPTGLLIDTVK